MRTTEKWWRSGLVAALVVTGLSVTPSASAADPAIIDNGTIQLGIHPEGQLNVCCGATSLGGTDVVGLRYLPTKAESTAPGCLCEGWGVADAISGESGWANEADGGTYNLDLVSFESTETTARSVVRAADRFEVTHDYHPSRTPNLYEVTVTIRNVGTSTTDVRYRRVMDWDIEPTAFSEYVTIETGTSSNLLYSSDDGFASSDPLSGPSWIRFEGEAVDSGPDDHGALFDFGFGELLPGTAVTFRTYYGAAGTQQSAIEALAAVRAEVFSFGQPGNRRGRDEGRPNTFIFAFAGVGGESIHCAEDGLEPLADSAAGGVASGLVHDRVEPVADAAGLGETVHTVNCDVVVPAEFLIEDALAS